MQIGPNLRRATAVFGLALAVAAPVAHADTMASQSGDAFVDSIGVNTHTTYNDTNYGNAPATIAALRSLGVRHIREGFALNRPDQYATLTQLANDGIHATLIMGQPGFAQLPDLVGALAVHVPHPDAIEGPNEWDLSGHADWGGELREYVTSLHALVGSWSSLEGVQTLGPSLTTVKSFRQLGSINGLVDGMSIHPYPWANMPEGATDAAASVASQVAPGQPIQVTESGYNDWLGGSPIGVMPGISQRAIAIYLPRLFLTNFASGIQRTFAYELLDNNLPLSTGVPESERHFGLLNADFSPKPSYIALRRMLGLLADPGPRFVTAPLRVTLGGDASALHHVLLQRRDGTYELALWRARPVFDPKSSSDLYPASSNVQVALTGRTSTWTAYRPSVTGSPTASGRGSTLSVPVGPDVTFVVLRSLSQPPGATGVLPVSGMAAGKPSVFPGTQPAGAARTRLSSARQSNSRAASKCKQPVRSTRKTRAHMAICGTHHLPARRRAFRPRKARPIAKHRPRARRR